MSTVNNLDILKHLAPPSPTPAEKVAAMVHQRDGILTQDLLLSPGRFGLGQIPDKQSPDATTTMTCGYCSTGCGLNIHMKDGEAINLSPTSEYPVKDRKSVV